MGHVTRANIGVFVDLQLTMLFVMASMKCVDYEMTSTFLTVSASKWRHLTMSVSTF